MAIFLASGFAQTGNAMTGIGALVSSAVAVGPQTATSFAIEIPGEFRLVMEGTGFAGYSGNRPTNPFGVITSWTGYDLQTGEEACVFTGFSMSVGDFNAWIATNDDAAFQNAIFGGNDKIIGSNFGGEDFWGFAGNDILMGGAGNDELHGGTGTDTASYASSSAAVQVNLATGTGVGGDAQGDTFDSIENLSGSRFNDTLTGSAVANVLAGADGDDTLSGGGGADMLRGGRGHDTMTGGAAADKFVFNSAVAAENSDTITDFTHATDKIQLENSVFTALGTTTGALAGVKFWASTTGNAHDLNDRITYNTGTGQLYYDDDGNGAHAKILIATLTAHPTLTASDIVVI